LSLVSGLGAVALVFFFGYLAARNFVASGIAIARSDAAEDRDVHAEHHEASIFLFVAGVLFLTIADGAVVAATLLLSQT
jgi:hypothetical protein